MAHVLQPPIVLGNIISLPARHHARRSTPFRCSAVASPQSASPRPTEGQGSTAIIQSPATSINEGSLVTTSGVEADINWESFLRSELVRNFQLGEVTADRYSPSFSFRDPIFTSTGLSSFQQNLRMLRSVFDIDFTLHNVHASGDEVVTRWTFNVRMKALPFAQKLVFTGKSFYRLDTGLLVSQTDVWDAVSNNEYLSVEGIAFVMRQALSPFTTPNLEGPRYTILQKRADYEVRRYEPYLIAEVSMPPGSSPASGTGFNDLAGYIFGGNTQRQSMEMTTPVITNAGQSGVEAKMAFVMESQYDLDNLPVPRDSRVERRRVDGGKVLAAWTFSGLPLDFEVVDAERRLRGALLVDGLKPKPSYQLARYNDPFTMPFLRRNEVLIELEGFEL